MVTQYIATRPIMDLYEEADRKPVARASKRWWNQERNNLAGEQAEAMAAAAAAAAAVVEEMEEADGATGEVPMTEVGG